MSLLFTTVPAKRLSRTLLATGSSLFLENIRSWSGAPLEASDFGTELYAVLRDAGNTVMELVELDPDTIDSPSGITMLRRGLSFTGDRTTEVTARKLDWTKNTTIVELGSPSPQVFQYLKDYIDGIAVAGAPDASTTSKGLVEMATAEEIDDDDDSGSTSAPLAVGPGALRDSKYGIFVAAATGMVVPYAGDTAPTGFLFADGDTYETSAQTGLALVTKGRFGLGTEIAFTANAGTDEIASVAHGLANGTILFLRSTTTLPAGLSPNTPYYVINQTINAFQLSLTLGGGAVDITGTGTGTHYYSKQFKVPDLRSRAVVGAGTGTKVATFASRSSNVITVTGLSDAANNEFQTGQAVLYSAPSGAMTGLTHNTTYYLIRTGNLTFSLATTLALAQNGTAIALSSDGTGTQTFTLTLTARTLGETGGEENHAMSSTELLSHSHLYDKPVTTGGAGGGGSLSRQTDQQTGATGGNAAMNIMNPFTVMNYIIKT